MTALCKSLTIVPEDIYDWLQRELYTYWSQSKIHFAPMWKTLVWQHHFINMGGLSYVFLLCLYQDERSCVRVCLYQGERSCVPVPRWAVVCTCVPLSTIFIFYRSLMYTCFSFYQGTYIPNLTIVHVKFHWFPSIGAYRLYIIFCIVMEAAFSVNVNTILSIYE